MTCLFFIMTFWFLCCALRGIDPNQAKSSPVTSPWLRLLWQPHRPEPQCPLKHRWHR
jgi:hypothetical protein